MLDWIVHITISWKIPNKREPQPDIDFEFLDFYIKEFDTTLPCDHPAQFRKKKISRKIHLKMINIALARVQQ